MSSAATKDAKRTSQTRERENVQASGPRVKNLVDPDYIVAALINKAVQLAQANREKAAEIINLALKIALFQLEDDEDADKFIDACELTTIVYAMLKSITLGFKTLNELKAMVQKSGRFTPDEIDQILVLVSREEKKELDV